MTSDRITANLPSRDFDITEQFYGTLGFQTVYRGERWMILARKGMEVEFFPHPDLDASGSWFSACMRLNDIDAVQAEWLDKGIATQGDAFPRMGAAPIVLGGDAPRMFTLHDPDGSLWRVLDNGDTA
ncbi:bleomycin resistance protein [Roseovarius sp. Pro17]|uniref:bleomycin resistance protein n=1 Tax=Roseovarius sp. Pro17 TaxID=3108175 RepID=UPI002D7928FB|nr:bleomycin resistance protein [Roseovarius sp. Pro17]